MSSSNTASSAASQASRATAIRLLVACAIAVMLTLAGVYHSQLSASAAVLDWLLHELLHLPSSDTLLALGTGLLGLSVASLLAVRPGTPLTKRRITGQRALESGALVVQVLLALSLANDVIANEQAYPLGLLLWSSSNVLLCAVIFGGILPFCIWGFCSEAERRSAWRHPEVRHAMALMPCASSAMLGLSTPLISLPWYYALALCVTPFVLLARMMLRPEAYYEAIPA